MKIKIISALPSRTLPRHFEIWIVIQVNWTKCLARHFDGMTTFQWIAWQLNRHCHQTHFSTFHWPSITHSLSYRYNEKLMAKFLFKCKRNQYQISLFRASRNTPSLVMMSYPGNEMMPIYGIIIRGSKQVISKCSSAAKPTVISQPS